MDKIIIDWDDINYIELLTEKWHRVAPETTGYVVCRRSEATHVVFTEVDLDLAGEDGENFTSNHVYSIRWTKESDSVLYDDKGRECTGFDLFMPCEYLKEKPETQKNQVMQGNEKHGGKVVAISEYRNNKDKGQ